MFPLNRLGIALAYGRLGRVQMTFIGSLDIRTELSHADRIVKFAGEGAWVPLPGWQVLLSAQDPVAILSKGDRLPLPPEQASQELLVVIDHAQRDWDDQAYCAVSVDGQIEIQWFAEAPQEVILGRVVLVVRPKRILDESLTKELWLTDE
jgi:hypothetical protein